MFGVFFPHYDSIVIEVNITGWDVKRLFIDEGNTASLLYVNYWEQIKVNSDHINFDRNEIIGFNRANSKPYG